MNSFSCEMRQETTGFVSSSVEIELPNGGVVQLPLGVGELVLAEPGLLAQVLTSKYADHIPLHRFQRISARHGVELSRQTTCGWAIQCADLFHPLYKLMIAEVLTSDVVNADDTTIKISDAQRRWHLSNLQ